ncbi:hypothetical protein HO543_01555 [Streptococcus suis]|nr:hypothetical protein [Streptococcus suis]NQJ76060.1 hypothetical protein [Streptococcus suis]
MEELFLSAEQALILNAVLIVLLVYLLHKPITIEIKEPVKKVQEKNEPKRNLRYLQIKRYYGG